MKQCCYVSTTRRIQLPISKIDFWQFSTAVLSQLNSYRQNSRSQAKSHETNFVLNFTWQNLFQQVLA